MKKFEITVGIRKVLMVLFFAVVGLSVFSLIVMALWNAILPDVLHVERIDFWQALGLLVLSKILFGGFMFRKRGWDKDGRSWPREMRERWRKMTPEQREQLKQRMRERCGGRWKMDPGAPASPSETAPGNQE